MVDNFKIYLTSENAILGIQNHPNQKSVSIPVEKAIFEECPERFNVDTINIKQPVNNIYLVKRDFPHSVKRYIRDNSVKDKIAYILAKE